MKKQSKKIIGLGASLLTLAIGLSAAENLVKNGNFDSAGEDGKFQNWKHGANVTVGKEAQNKFARIKNPTPGEYVSINSDDIEIKPEWEKLALHVKMRINSLDENSAKKPGDVPRAMLVFTTASGEKHFRPICHLAEKTDGKFVELWEEVEIPPDSKVVALVFDLSVATGEFDIDDVQLFADHPKCVPLSVLNDAGKFEQKRKIGAATPPSWITTYQIYSQATPPIRIEEENGKKFLRVENNDANKDLYCENFFKLDPSWKKVNISAKIRAKDLKCGSEIYHDARIMVTFADDKGNRVGGYGEVPCVKADQDWKEISAVREVPEGATAIRLQIGLFHSTGTADFDDVKVEESK